MTARRDPLPAVAGPVRLILRLEAAALFVAAVGGYHLLGGSWFWFALLFLTPDLSMFGYLAGPGRGAVAYNLVHSTVLPACLGLAGLLGGWPWAELGALIWLAHIGFDRVLGYGLKYPVAFGATHLGWIGKGGR